MAKRAKTVLAGMDFDSLMNLRKQIDEALTRYRSTLERQLASIGGSIASIAGGDKGRGSKMKGKKVAPKYRGPEGELWAGRGATPRWLAAAIKGGKKRDDFLIEKSARKKRRGSSP